MTTTAAIGVDGNPCVDPAPASLVAMTIPELIHHAAVNRLDLPSLLAGLARWLGG